MTPLLGTKNPSAPVGDAPAGDNKAAQAAAFQVFTNHETRDTALAWREAQASVNSVVFTNHETRDTKHGFFAFLAAFLQVVERHGAAMARHGRPPSPRTGNKACMVFTNHSFPTHDFPRFPGISHQFPAPPPPSAVLGRPHASRRHACQISSFTLRVKKHGLSGSLAVRHFFWSD